MMMIIRLLHCIVVETSNQQEITEMVMMETEIQRITEMVMMETEIQRGPGQGA
jgi:hypothetical protein